MGEFAGRVWRKLASSLSFGAVLMEEERRMKKKGSRVDERECRGAFAGSKRKRGCHAKCPKCSSLSSFFCLRLIHIQYRYPNSKPKSII